MLRYIANSIGVTEFPFKLHFCVGHKCALQTQLINSDNQSDSLHRETDIRRDGDAISIRIMLRSQKVRGEDNVGLNDAAAIFMRPDDPRG